MLKSATASLLAQPSTNAKQSERIETHRIPIETASWVPCKALSERLSQWGGCECRVCRFVHSKKVNNKQTNKHTNKRSNNCNNNSNNNNNMARASLKRIEIRFGILGFPCKLKLFSYHLTNAKLDKLTAFSNTLIAYH